MEYSDLPEFFRYMCVFFLAGGYLIFIAGVLLLAGWLVTKDDKK